MVPNVSYSTLQLAPHVVLALRPSRNGARATKSAIAADKVAAYMETHYSVRTPEPITLRIGVANERVIAAVLQHRASSCAFVTAYNPCGAAIADADNLARHELLLLDLKKHGCAFYEGAGGHPDNGWPEEKSCLCFGLAFDDACDLGAKWGQDAIVWCDVDGVPQLVLLR
jgi:hypothetical protein